LKVPNDRAEAFVKTSQLDGERNLKPKLGFKEVNSEFDNIFKQGSKSHIEIQSIPPVKELYTYTGRIIHHKEDGESKKYSVDLNQFLHRGSFIENSEYVLAAVVHTGTESKLIMNLGGYNFKRSRFEKILNMLLVGNLCLSLTCTIIGTIACSGFNYANWDKDYLYEKINP
jgi:magnesium-transporting ATPase (P-type)